MSQTIKALSIPEDSMFASSYAKSVRYLSDHGANENFVRKVLEQSFVFTISSSCYMSAEQ